MSVHASERLSGGSCAHLRMGDTFGMHHAMQCNAGGKVFLTPEFRDKKIDRTTSVVLNSFFGFRLILLLFIIQTHALYCTDLSSLDQSYDILRHQLAADSAIILPSFPHSRSFLLGSLRAWPGRA